MSMVYFQAPVNEAGSDSDDRGSVFVEEDGVGSIIRMDDVAAAAMMRTLSDKDLAAMMDHTWPNIRTAAAVEAGQRWLKALRGVVGTTG